ncbi:MAG: V-type ATPase 116kDa subunit family protein [Anaerosomatales bacterium]|nr:V-type ATPase 116kDa subunit family protein [Anaerosomatales bacterium]
MLVPMAKVELIGPKNRFFEVVSLLHDQGTLHIEDLSKKIQQGEVPLEQMEVVENQQAEKERMEDLLIRLRSILKALHLPDTTVDEAARQKSYLELWQKDAKELASDVTDVLEQVEDKTSALAQAQSSMEAEIALLGRYEPILQKIQPLAKQIVTTGAYDSVALLVERRYKGALEELKKELDQITNAQCEIVSTDVDEDTTAVIVVFAKKYSEAVHKFLAMENVNQVRLPSDFQDMPFDVAYDQIKERRAELPKKLEAVRKELDELSGTWYLRLVSIRDVLVDKIDELSAIPKFGQTEYAFVITGWLPADDVKALRKMIVEHFGTDVIVDQLEIDEHDFDETPVALKNPKWAEPASFAMSYLMGGKPKYGTIDPSIIWAISYPLIFGMIVGDIGYGAIMLAIILWLRFKYKENNAVQLATGLLGPAATAAILFGFFYGEFFGGVFWEAGWIQTFDVLGFTIPYNREHVVEPLMLMALGLGVVQILFGLILGTVNSIKTKHKKHAFVKGGLTGFIVGAIILLIAAFLLSANLAPIVQAIGAVVMLVGFLAVLRFGGIMGVVETLESVSHIASYIRVMAVGLSDAIFATAINRMAANDMIPTVVGIVLLLLFHGLHLILAIFTPTIHALRLNFLEFGGKYYEASKSEYEPFHKTGGEKSA